MTLIEFLLARIAEDKGVAEEVAKVAREAPYVGDIDREAERPVYKLTGLKRGNDVMLISPVRVLAECKAKRRRLEIHEPYEHAAFGLLCGACAGGQGEGLPWPCPTVKTDALPYADHYDYDPKWSL